MTREEALQILDTIPTIGEQVDALEMAIQALSQEPTNTWSIKDVADTFKKHGLIREQEPCDDAISRQAVLDRIRESIETYHNQYTTDMLNMWGLFTQFIKEMPSVNPQPCDDAISREAILSKIKEVCFSEEWTQFRLDNGSNGQRDFLINYIEQLPPVTRYL